MKYGSWEEMVNAQAIAFSALCAQNPRLMELADKADESYDSLTPAERDEYAALLDEVHNDPFFARRCAKEREEMEAQERP